jgi:acetylornithine deacetylase/succinyl-diaminopimelate desuccinylase family protein
VLDKVLAAVDADRDALVDAVSRAVRIPSVNPKSEGMDYDEHVGREGEVSRLVAEHYREAGCEVDLFAIEPGRENAVGVLRGSGGGRSLIFNGHVDVVPPGDPARWSSGDPFSGRVDGDRIWGRGACDMKSGVLAQAFAARALAAAGVRLRGDLIVEAVVGEETGDHTCGVTAVCERGYTADAAVVSEPSRPPAQLAVLPASFGLLVFEVTVTGKSTHGALRGITRYPAAGGGMDIGVSAIDKGFDVFQTFRALEDAWTETKRHALFAPGSFGILPAQVQGGARGTRDSTTMSDYLTLRYALHYPPGEEPDAIKAEVERFLSASAERDPWLSEHPPTIRWISSWPPFDVPTDHPIVQATREAHARAADGTPFAGLAPMHGMMGGCDATFLERAGIPAITYGPGDLRRAHGADEHVLIEELVIATRTYAALALAWCEVAA